MGIKRQDKTNVISYDEFNKIIDHTDFHHDPPALDPIPDDENNNPAEETLMGMEYDFDTESDDEDALDEDIEYERGEDLDDNDDDYEQELAHELSEDEEGFDFDEQDEGYSEPEDFEGDLSADSRNKKYEQQHRS